MNVIIDLLSPLNNCGDVREYKSQTQVLLINPLVVKPVDPNKSSSPSHSSYSCTREYDYTVT